MSRRNAYFLLLPAVAGISGGICLQAAGIANAPAWGMLTAALVGILQSLRRGSLPGALTTLIPLGLCLRAGILPGAPALIGCLTVASSLLLTAGVRRENPARGLRQAMHTAVPLSISAALLLLLVPQETYVNRSAMMQSKIRLFPGVSIGTPDARVNLADLPEQGENRAVMQVTAGSDGPVYLRGREYDRYTGQAWLSEGGREEVLLGSGVYEEIRIETAAVEEILYLPFGTSAVLKNGCAENREQLTDYVLRRYNRMESRAPGPEWTALPEPARTDCTAFLRERILPGAGVSETVAAIEAFVRDSARYDKSPEPMPADAPDFAVWFLEEADRGYCVHFASSAAVLLRCAGIPARYVTGYLVSGRAGKPVTVTSEDAHAWAEYYMDGCWKILDAVPGAEAVPVSRNVAAGLLMWVLPMAAAVPAGLLLRRGFQSSQELLRRHTGSTNARALAIFRQASGFARRRKREMPGVLSELAGKARYSSHAITGEELARMRQASRALRRRK